MNIDQALLSGLRTRKFSWRIFVNFKVILRLEAILKQRQLISSYFDHSRVGDIHSLDNQALRQGINSLYRVSVSLVSFYYSFSVECFVYQCLSAFSFVSRGLASRLDIRFPSVSLNSIKELWNINILFFYICGTSLR